MGTGGDFYGMTISGGTANKGAVFKISPSGEYTVIHSFADGSVPDDGWAPLAGLTLGTTLEGTLRFFKIILRRFPVRKRLCAPASRMEY
jgi:uncharacterized repeat protein (TIGR03803 family)